MGASMVTIAKPTSRPAITTVRTKSHNSKPPADRYTLVAAPTTSKSSAAKCTALTVKHDTRVLQLRDRLTEVLITQEAERQIVSTQLQQQRSQLQSQQQTQLQQLVFTVDALKDQLAQQAVAHQHRVRAFLDARQQRLRDAMLLLQRTAAERSQQLYERHAYETGQLTRRYTALTSASTESLDKSTAHLSAAHHHQLQETEKQYAEQHQQQAAGIQTLRQQLQSVNQMVEQQAQHLHTLQQRLTQRHATCAALQNKQQQLQQKCGSRKQVHDQAVAAELQCTHAEEQLQYQQSKNYIMKSEYQKLEGERNSIRLSLIKQIEAVKLKNRTMNETLESNVVDMLQRIPESDGMSAQPVGHRDQQDTAIDESDYSESGCEDSYTEASYTQSSDDADESYSQSFAGERLPVDGPT